MNKRTCYCGSDNLDYEIFGNKGHIECQSCGARGPAMGFVDADACHEQATWAAWNAYGPAPQTHPGGVVMASTPGGISLDRFCNDDVKAKSFPIDSEPSK